MTHMPSSGEEVIRLFIIVSAYFGAVASTIFSLTHGIFAVFPFLYILPIILAVYFYPKRSVIITLGISLTYIGLIYLLGFTNPSLIAIATAWFAIFITIGVVFSSYANQLYEERERIRKILDNSQDGIFCFDVRTQAILDINLKCAGWLRYERPDLVGRPLAIVWADGSERERFIAGVNSGELGSETEGVFRAKDGTLLRLVVSTVLVSGGRVLCSVIDLTGSKIAEEEIRKTLEDLEEQVRARTAHLERINEELHAEILEHRMFERMILSEEGLPLRDEDDE